MICVLGTHRSGTSAITRVINLLGADLGEPLMSPGFDNETGFWEHLTVVNIHDRLLAELGSAWDDPAPLPANWLQSAAARDAEVELTALARSQFSASRLWAVKDPRLCRLLPLWHRILRDLGVQPRYVLVVRHPEEVAISLNKRNQIPVNHADAIYVEHLLAAEAGSRDAPRTIVRYDALLKDWRTVVDTIGSDLGIEWPHPVSTVAADIDAFLQPALRHSTSIAADSDTASESWADACYRAALSMDRSAWDWLHDRYHDSSRHFAVGVGHLRNRIADLHAERARLRHAVEAHGVERTQWLSERQVFSAEHDRVQTERDRIQAELDRAASEQRQLLERLAVADALIQRLESVVSEHEKAQRDVDLERLRHRAHVDVLERAVGDRELQIQAMTASASWKLTRSVRGVQRVARALSPVALEHRARRLFHRLPLPPRIKRSLADIYHRLSGNEAVLARLQQERRLLQQHGTFGHIDGRPLPELDIVDVGDADAAGVAAGLAFSTRPDPVVSIVIPVFNHAAYTVACLASMQRHPASAPVEILIIDDGSTDRTADIVGGIPGLTFIRNHENRGFIRNCNLGAERARGRYVVFLNNDTQVQDGWLDKLVEVFESQTDAGLAGSKLVYPRGHLQEAGALILPDGRAELVGLNDDPRKPEYNVLRRVDYCSGACFMVPRAFFLELGGFDEHFLPAYCEDSDLAFRVRRAGRHVYYQPASLVAHHLSVTTGTTSESRLAQIERNRVKFVERWRDEIDRLNTVRLIAFYLPQYHPIPENDAWWGEGFTEWTNVVRGKPNFAGHYQPHVPGDLGYYDLRLPETRQAQADLAQQFGIDAFCYYYYWFSGTKLLQRPVEEVVASGRPDHHFCLCWANENWTRTWDGKASELLMQQGYHRDDPLRFFEAIAPILGDARYVRIDGKPLLLVYNVAELPNPRHWSDTWRAAARVHGLGDLYLAYVKSVFANDLGRIRPADLGFDAAVEFPPNELAVPGEIPGMLLNPHFRGKVFDYDKTARAFVSRPVPDHVVFRGVMPGWDNTARRQDASHIFVSSPETYEAWLRDAISFTRRFRFGDERIVFINAWNEWAEGNHLEPDRHFGYRFLEATRRALGPFARPRTRERPEPVVAIARERSSQ